MALLTLPPPFSSDDKIQMIMFKYSRVGNTYDQRHTYILLLGIIYDLHIRPVSLP